MLEPYGIGGTSKVAGTSTGLQGTRYGVFFRLVLEFDRMMQEPTCTGVGGMEHGEMFESLNDGLDSTGFIFVVVAGFSETVHNHQGGFDMHHHMTENLKVVPMTDIQGVDTREVLRMRCQQVRCGQADPTILQIPQGFGQQLLWGVKLKDEDSTLVSGLPEPCTTLGHSQTQGKRQDRFTTLGWSPQDVEGPLHDEVVDEPGIFNVGEGEVFIEVE